MWLRYLTLSLSCKHMRYFTNHCWCSDSIHGGCFDCRFIVTIEREVDVVDWPKIIDKVECFDQKNYEFRKDFFSSRREVTDEWLMETSMKSSITLKPHVIEWLEANVKDKGWTIGSPVYNSANTLDLDVFFIRRRDAMKFIKEFSVHKKPTAYFDYFRDKRMVLDTDTGKLVIVP